MKNNQNTNQAALDLLDKMRKALQKDGDFPASARVVNELRTLISNTQTTAAQITEVILKEPSLGTRVLHLVNSSFYRRAKPIMTVSQAVIQVGMRPLAELCSGLVLLQKFIPVAGRGGAFAECLQRSIVTALLASQLGKKAGNNKNDQDEQGYLIGSFSEMGALLLAYYFPKMYESAAKRSQLKNCSIEQSIHELTGLTPLQISIEVLDALNLPDYYKQILHTTLLLQTNKIASIDKTVPQLIISLAKNLAAAQDLSKLITSNPSIEELSSLVNELEQKYGLSTEITNSTLTSLPELFKDHCKAIELNLPKLPAVIERVGKPLINANQTTITDNPEQFQQIFNEIQQSIDSKASTATIITTVMETFAWTMNFDRVVLLLVDKERKKLLGRMALGSKVAFDPRSIERTLGNLSLYAADLSAFSNGEPVFTGDPVLEQGWPLTAIPIGSGDKAVGVIYADRVNSDEDGIAIKDQKVINLLADLLNKSVLSHSKG